MDLKDKLEGGIYGFLIGNALAAQCHNKKLTYNIISQQLAKRYTDAGSMMLATMSSILESSGIDFEDVAYTLHEWYIGGFLSSGAYSQSRASVSQALRLYTIGTPFDRCGSLLPEMNDNSALIRMLPFIFWYMSETPITMIRGVQLATKFTNQQPEALICSALFSIVIKNAILSVKEKASQSLFDLYTTNNMSQELKTLEQVMTVPTKIYGTSNTIDSFWSTMKIYSKFSDDFEKAIIEAILLGGDIEATASLTGSLVGVTLGKKAIPNRLLEQLQFDSTQEIGSLISRFVNNCVQKINQEGIS